jgi:hypothetical protein
MDNEQVEAAHESARKRQLIAAVPYKGKDKDWGNGPRPHDQAQGLSE